MNIPQIFSHLVKKAKANVLSGIGGPFAAAIVKNGRIISEACNSVTSTNDPTAHAEVLAIRKACAKLKKFRLNGYKLYTTCEPCPMCFGALYWARVDAIHFCSTKEDAADAGFADEFIYKQLNVLPVKRKIREYRHVLLISKIPFKTWIEFEKKIKY